MSEDQIKKTIDDAIKAWANSSTTLDDWTALHLACKEIDEIFMYLVEDLGADLNKRSKEGISVLHKAAICNNTYLLTYLVDSANFKLDD